MHSNFMKTTIKIFTLTLLLASSLTASAQSIKKRFTSDIHIGVNLSKMDNKDNEYTQPKLGMHIGVNVNYKIIGNIQIQSGFYVSKKGLKLHKGPLDQEGVISTVRTEQWQSTTGTYIQVPLNLGYEVFVTKKVAFNINAGVYGAYGYKGKGTERSVTTTFNGNETPVTEFYGPVEFESFEPLRWRRFDYGLNGNIGFVYDIYTFNVNYEHGLYNVLNLGNAANIGQTLKNRNISVSLGFRF